MKIKAFLCLRIPPIFFKFNRLSCLSRERRIQWEPNILHVRNFYLLNTTDAAERWFTLTRRLISSANKNWHNKTKTKWLYYKILKSNRNAYTHIRALIRHRITDRWWITLIISSSWHLLVGGWTLCLMNASEHVHNSSSCGAFPVCTGQYQSKVVQRGNGGEAATESRVAEARWCMCGAKSGSWGPIQRTS